MGFWIFMMVTVLLIPLSMMIFGKMFSKAAPAKINSLFGYRTTMSMKNEETWKFAHTYFGRIWYVAGLIALFPSIVAMLFVLGKEKDTVGYVGMILCLLQMLPLFIPILFTEVALKKEFDKDGRRIL